MDRLSPLQIYVNEKVLSEIRQTEKNLIAMNAYWQEGYDIVETSSIPEEFSTYGTDEEANKVDRLDRIELDFSAIPLRWIKMPDSFFGAVTKINWHSILTKKTSRKIEFGYDGTITISKKPRIFSSKKNQRNNSYNASYNVLHDDFKLQQEILTVRENAHYKTECEKEETEISRINNIITKRHNGIEIRQDLVSEKTYIKITTPNDKEHNASSNFYVTLDRNGTVEKVTLEINTHKGNGKVDGTYRLIVTEEDGIEAYFCTRKGIHIPLEVSFEEEQNKEQSTIVLPQIVKDLTSISALVIPKTSSDQRISSILETASVRPINFDYSKFNEQAIKEAEQKSEELLKRLKDEIPLEGLISRMDECQSIIEDKKTASMQLQKSIKTTRK